MIFIWILLSVIVAAFGSSRVIGFGWTLIASLVLSPLVGLILVLLSERKSDKEYKEKMLRYMAGQSISDERDNPMLKNLAEQKKKNIDTKVSRIIIAIAALVVMIIIGNVIYDSMNNRKITMEIEESAKRPELPPREDLIYRIKNDLAYSRDEIDTTFVELGKIITFVDGFDVGTVNLWSAAASNRKQKASLKKGTVVCIMKEENGYILVGTPKAQTFEWGYCLPEFVKK